MRLALPIVWSDRHRLHEPGGEVWVGLRTPGTEVPARADAIRAALEACDARVRRGRTASRRRRPRRPRRVAARVPPHGLGRVGEGRPARRPGPGPGRPVRLRPPRAHAALTPTVPVATWARPGYFAYDTMTLGRPRDLRGGPRARSTRRSPRPTSCGRRRARRIRVHPPARPPRHAHRPRRLVLPQQRGRGRRPAAGTHRRPRRGDRHRRPPRQRHPGDLLRPCRRAHRLGPRRPGRRGGSRTSSASPSETGGGAEPQPPARARARATPSGSRPCATSARFAADTTPPRSSSPSASTPPPATPRARCR